MAFVVDLFAMGILWLFADGVVLLSGYFFAINRFELGRIAMAITARAAGILLVIFYFPVSWLLTGGRSAGKVVFGLRIERVDGRPLRVRTCLVREAAYWISAVPFCLGFLWILFDHDRRGWHDRLSGTRVVYDEL